MRFTESSVPYLSTSLATQIGSIARVCFTVLFKKHRNLIELKEKIKYDTYVCLPGKRNVCGLRRKGELDSL